MWVYRSMVEAPSSSGVGLAPLLLTPLVWTGHEGRRRHAIAPGSRLRVGSHWKMPAKGHLLRSDQVSVTCARLGQRAVNRLAALRACKP